MIKRSWSAEIDGHNVVLRCLGHWHWRGAMQLELDGEPIAYGQIPGGEVGVLQIDIPIAGRMVRLEARGKIDHFEASGQVYADGCVLMGDENFDNFEKRPVRYLMRRDIWLRGLIFGAAFTVLPYFSGEPFEPLGALVKFGVIFAVVVLVSAGIARVMNWFGFK